MPILYKAQPRHIVRDALEERSINSVPRHALVDAAATRCPLCVVVDVAGVRQACIQQTIQGRAVGERGNNRAEKPRRHAIRPGDRGLFC